MSAPLFSIVVATFNRAELLRRTLASVLAQEHRDWELLVVDDGSTDETPDVVAELGERATYLRQENRGPSAARNLGIARARGRYVCTLDSDDLWFPWTLATFEAAIRSAGHPSMVAGELVRFSQDPELTSVPRGEPRFERYLDFFASSRAGIFVGSCLAVYERSALTRAAGFDPSLFNMEDHDLSLRLGTEPGFVKIRSPITLGYRQHAGSIQSAQRSADGLLECLQREAAGLYPGGRTRAAERRRILTLHARPVSLACAREGLLRRACRIYRRTLPWNARERRARYLVGFPLLGVRGWMSARAEEK